MGKASKWIRNFLTGKKGKETEKVTVQSISNHQIQPPFVIAIEHPTTPITIPPTTPKEKRRWSFRRSSATAPVQREFICMSTTPPMQNAFVNSENDQKKHALAVAVATAAAADAAAAAAKAVAAVFQLTAAAAAASGRANAIEEAAAIKIQSAFRGYLARTASNALRGLVKLQALIRAHLVRKQATATLRCMQALVTAQERARAQRIQMAQDSNINKQKQFNDGKSSKENRFKHSNQDLDRVMEEHIKIVEMDVGEFKGDTKSRSSYSSYGQTQRMDPRISTQSAFSISHQENQQMSPSPSAINDLSPKARSSHFEEYSLCTAQSSPQYYYSDISKPDPSNVVPVPYARSELGDSYYTEYPFYPSYMANTQSSRAKVRSHSAPKQRPEAFERQPSRRSRPSIDGRNVPRAVRMQRSSSQVGAAAQNYQYPWSVKLDKSNMSLKDSECGSNYTVLTNNTNYCRSLVGFEVQTGKY